MSDKEKALQVIQKLPDDISLEDIMYELYFRARIDEGIKQLDEGKVVSHEDVKRSLTDWLQSAGR